MIEQIPLSERPRERCLAFGAETLSLRECLAVILGSGPRGIGCMGLAAAILRQVGHGVQGDGEEDVFLRAWGDLGGALFAAVPGLGPAQKSRLLAAFELGRRLSLLTKTIAHSASPTLHLTTLEAHALGRVSRSLRASGKEWLGFVPVFSSGRLGTLRIVERGTRTYVNVDRRQLFLEILLSGAPAFILMHNHPSGNPQPSAADVLLTSEVERAAAPLGLRCLSHLVVTLTESCVVEGDRPDA